MATNKYFNKTTQRNEQNLFEDLVVESIQINGFDIYYLPRDNIDFDEILLEPTQSKFDRYFTIEALMPDGGQFGGQGDILGKFGYQIDQTTEIIISKKRWEELGSGLLRPREGDVVYIGDASNIGSNHASFVNTFWQINQVWFNNPDWQLGKHFTYKLTMKTFVNSHEKFETGNTELDVMNIESMNDITKGVNKASKEFEEMNIVNRKNPFGDF